MPVAGRRIRSNWIVASSRAVMVQPGAMRVFVDHHGLLFSDYRTDPQVRQRVTERFLAAVMGGDLNALMQVLAPDVTVWADGAGKARAAGAHPLHGRDKVTRLIIGDAFRHPIPDLNIRYRRVNGEPAAPLLSGPPLHARIPRSRPRRRPVRGIYVVTNPDKPSRLG
jgi:hypothetical protein